MFFKLKIAQRRSTSVPEYLCRRPLTVRDFVAKSAMLLSCHCSSCCGLSYKLSECGPGEDEKADSADKFRN